MPLRTVAYLKPYATTWDAFLQELDPDTSAEVPAYDERLDELIEDQIEHLRSIASGLGIEVHVDEYELMQLRNGQRASSGGIVSHARRRQIETADILCVTNPPPAVLATIMQCVMKHPLMRSIIGYTRSADFEEGISMASRLLSLVLIPDEPPQWLPRLFPVQLAKMDQTSNRTMSDALLFPNIAASRYAEDPNALIMPRTIEAEEMDLRDA